MTDRSRNLPPLSNRSLPKDPATESESERPKPRRKKAAGGQSDTESPRRRPRKQSVAEESDGVTSPTEDTPRTRRKRTKTPGPVSVTNGDVQTNGHARSMEDESQPAADTISGSTISKTKKKKKKQLGTSRETLTTPSPTEDDEKNKPKKKKKKKRVASEIDGGEEVGEYNLGLAAELAQIEDDVVDAEDMDEERQSVQIGAPVMRSEPLGTMFIERKKGFKAADKIKLARRMEEEQQKFAQLPPEPASKTTIQFGLTTHRVFKTFTLFCHGLFAGFAFWHIVVVFTMIDTSGVNIFLDYYYRLAQPVQSLYFILFVFCTVSTLDRYDLSCVNKRFVVRALTLQNGTVSCLFYFIGLIFSLSIAATDDKISLYKYDPALWPDVQTATSELNTWRILNLVRGVAAILGWLVISLRPNTDRLVKNLQKAEENAIGDELNMGRTSAA